MAVDAEGNLLVIDMSNQTVSRFKPDGTPANFSALDTNVIDGKSGADETPQGRVLGPPILASRGANEAGVAVDSSGGVANGNIYVTDAEAHVVDIFSSSGEHLGQLSEFGGLPLGETCGVTVDANGAVYIGDYNNGVQKYVPTSNPPTNADFTATFTSVANPAALAAGRGATAGSLFVDSYGEGTISKIDSSTGAFEYTVTEAATPSEAVLPAVDPVSSHVYVGQGMTVVEYDAASSVSPTRVSAITGPQRVEGVAVSGTSSQVYVSRNLQPFVSVYGPLAPPVPFIESQSVASVASTEAVLEAQINPEGSATSFWVEYGPTEGYGVTTPVDVVGDGETSHLLRARITDLLPGVEYHFRFVASNAVGTSEGSDRAFRTRKGIVETEACSNQAFRTGPSSRLSSCRAYEMVSPVAKGGLSIEPPLTIGSFRAALNQVSSSGNAFTYSTSQGFAAPEGAAYVRQYLANRTDSGWHNSSITGPQNISHIKAADRIDLEYRIFSPDLCQGALLNWSEPALVAPAVDDAPNIYSRHLCGSRELGAVSSDEHLSEPEVGGMSADGRCVVYFYNELDLRRVRGEGFNVAGGLYETCEGVTARLDLLPDGSPSEGLVVAGASAAENTGPERMLRLRAATGAVSEDASIVYWTDIGGDAGAGQLFVRVNSQQAQSTLGPENECLELSKACTIPVSAPVESEGNRAIFATASKDGSRAYYYFGAGGQQPGNLYEFDLASRTSRLVAGGLPSGLNLSGGRSPNLTPVVGASDDGSRVYFFSREALGGEGIQGELNLYLLEAPSPTAGNTELVATLSLDRNAAREEPGPTQSGYYRTARMTPDGQHVVFTTTEALTGYDNRGQSGEPAVEVYVYDAAANGGEGRLDCASCNPAGQRPQTRRLVMPRKGEPGEVILSEAEYAALIPGYYTVFHGPRAITDDGSRVFFESFDALVAGDTNSKADVYEWIEEGASGCTQQKSAYSPVNRGCVSLISSGQSSIDSKLIDASGDGRDVFIATAQSLVPQDPGLVDIYDARIGGGFPAPAEGRASCEGDACQLTPPLIAPQQSGSARFTGPGNTRRKHKHKCRRKGKKPCRSHARGGKHGKKSKPRGSKQKGGSK